MDPQLLTTLAPAGVYLLGLVAALKHIAKLYEARHEAQRVAHELIIKTMKDGHEARFELLEQSAKECVEDRNILRRELNQLRERLLLQESVAGLAAPTQASPTGTSAGEGS